MMLQPRKPRTNIVLFVTEETVKLQQKDVIRVERVSVFKFAHCFQSA
jgi:hypothetical protein